MQDQDQPENGIFIEITNNGKARERPDGRVEMKESCLGVNPADSESYFDRCAVHQMVSDLQKLHPKWPNEDYVKHLQSFKVNGRILPFEPRTIEKWVLEIVPSKKGRPRGRKNTLKR